MENKRKTCAGCKHLVGTPIMNANIYSCQKTGFVVPHHWSSSEVVFWRIPLNCPLPDSEVVKSDEKADRSDWVTIKSSDLVA